VKCREVGLCGRAGDLRIVHFFDHFLDDEVEQVLRGLEPIGMKIAVLLQ
jgi:hypothetical protein